MEKIVLEVALQEFDRFVEEMSLDIDESQMDEDDKKGLAEQKTKFIKAVQNGSLIVNDKGEPVFTPVRSEPREPITFKEPTGATLQAMDQKKTGHDMGKMMAVMGAMTGTHPKLFANMALADLKVCTAITTLFLG